MPSTPKLTNIQKNGRKILLRGLCEMIAAAKEKNNSDKVPYGYYQRMLSNIKQESPWVTLDILKKAFRGYEAAIAAQRKDAPPTSIITENSTDSLSTLSSPSFESSTNHGATATTRDGADVSNATTRDGADVSNTTGSNEAHGTDVSSTVNPSQRSKGGRSKGTTKAAIDHKKKAIKALQNEIVASYLEEKKNCGKKI